MRSSPCPETLFFCRWIPCSLYIDGREPTKWLNKRKRPYSPRTFPFRSIPRNATTPQRLWIPQQLQTATSCTGSVRTDSVSIFQTILVPIVLVHGAYDGGHRGLCGLKLFIESTKMIENVEGRRECKRSQSTSPRTQRQSEAIPVPMHCADTKLELDLISQRLVIRETFQAIMATEFFNQSAFVISTKQMTSSQRTNKQTQKAPETQQANIYVVVECKIMTQTITHIHSG